MTDEELRTLILNDATAKAFADVGKDSACAERCSAIADPVRRLVPNREIKRQAIIDGYWAAIVMTGENAAADAQLRGLCINVGDWVKDMESTTDFDLTPTKTMLAGLVASTLVTQEQADTLNTLANIPQNITGEQVSRALMPLRTDGKVKVL